MVRSSPLAMEVWAKAEELSSGHRLTVALSNESHNEQGNRFDVAFDRMILRFLSFVACILYIIGETWELKCNPSNNCFNNNILTKVVIIVMTVTNFGVVCMMELSINRLRQFRSVGKLSSYAIGLLIVTFLVLNFKSWISTASIKDTPHHNCRYFGAKYFQPMYVSIFKRIALSLSEAKLGHDVLTLLLFLEERVLDDQLITLISRRVMAVFYVSVTANIIFYLILSFTWQEVLMLNSASVASQSIWMSFCLTCHVAVIIVLGKKKMIHEVVVQGVVIGQDYLIPLCSLLLYRVLQLSELSTIGVRGTNIDLTLGNITADCAFNMVLDSPSCRATTGVALSCTYNSNQTNATYNYNQTNATFN
jgi:hypothetical protein